MVAPLRSQAMQSNPALGRLANQQVIGMNEKRIQPMMPPPQTSHITGVDPRTGRVMPPTQTGGGLPPEQALPTQQPQFGLGGAEQALQAGLGGGISALEQGQQSALGTLGLGQNIAQQNLQQGQSALAGGAQAGLGRIQQGLGGANRMLQGGMHALGGNFSSQAVNVDPSTGQPLFQQAAQGVGAFSPAGLQAQGMQLALSGAQGQEAFDQAMIDNPMQALLNRRGQEALVNQAAASGGLGSGQFQTELQQLGQAQASQDVQRQIQNLNQLSGQGLQAAGQQGQFLSQAGQQQGNLAAQNAQLGTQVGMANASNRLGAAGQMANLFGQGAGMQQQAGLAGANLLGQAAGQQANLFGQGAGIAASLAGQGAGIQSGMGQNAANLFAGTGQNIAQNRFQTGRDLANQISGTTSQLSNLASQQGSGLSDILGGGGSNLANLLSGFGQGQAGQNERLATLLANLSVGQGTQQAGFTQQAGNAVANANLAAEQGKQQAAITALSAFFSDERLKDNIVKTGEVDGVNFYSWTWNDKMPIKELIGSQDRGVIAQELELSHPDLVITDESGYKKVNYADLGVMLCQ